MKKIVTIYMNIVSLFNNGWHTNIERPKENSLYIIYRCVKDLSTCSIFERYGIGKYKDGFFYDAEGLMNADNSSNLLGYNKSSICNDVKMFKTLPSRDSNKWKENEYLDDGDYVLLQTIFNNKYIEYFTYEIVSLESGKAYDDMCNEIEDPSSFLTNKYLRVKRPRFFNW